MSLLVSERFAHRHAGAADIPALRRLIDRAIRELQSGFLSPEQIEASRSLMGLDTQLIEDGTYFVIASGGIIAGSGGWSRRATPYGGDHSAGRDMTLLDPARDAAKVRAMYTCPDFARRGIGRTILGLCERAAAAEGFSRVELTATMAGEPLYLACGYRVMAREMVATETGARIPLARMEKAIASSW
jgi:GNAT superfamily N-acetyltransferase